MTLIIIWTQYRFLYDGERINEDDTPALLDMEDNGKISLSQRNSHVLNDDDLVSDTIDVMVERESLSPQYPLAHFTNPDSSLYRGRRIVAAYVYGRHHMHHMGFSLNVVGSHDERRMMLHFLNLFFVCVYFSSSLFLIHLSGLSCRICEHLKIQCKIPSSPIHLVL